MKTWKDCAQFHGHECGGLTIGYKASLYAIQLLNLEFSSDEQVVCIAENDACGIDAIQFIDFLQKYFFQVICDTFSF